MLCTTRRLADARIHGSQIRFWPALLLPLALCGCGKGDWEPPFTELEGDSATTSDAADSGDSDPANIAPPALVNFAVDSNGSYGPDELGFQGQWLAEAGPDSEIELSFDDGAVCLSGETAQIIDNDYGTYWGARATFGLCQTDDGTQAASECLGARARRDFVGVAFSLEGSSLPWLVSIQFNETDRESPTSMWLQTEGETLALFERATNPFDSSAPPLNPNDLESVTVRAVGSTDGAQSFDFCLRDFRALFGEEWAESLIPDWLNEPGLGKQVDYVGANLVGAEFGEQSLPGVYGSDYIYPGVDEVDLYANKGMNIFRVPFRWERMQPELYADLDETELGYLEATIDAAHANDATVIIDPHNFARYEDDPSDDLEPMVIGVDVEQDAFADFWAKLAREFANDELVWFGLMNEPHDMETEIWLDAANAAIAAIREEGAGNLVLVPGNQWTGAHAWFESYYGTPNAEVLRDIVDLEDNFAIELHQYFDAGSSGTSNTCVSEAVGIERVQGVTDWLKEEGFLGFLGEFGGSEDPVCLGAMDNLLSHLGDNADVWLGWTIWAASQWNIQHNVRPLANGDDVPQMRVLYRHMDAP